MAYLFSMERIDKILLAQGLAQSRTQAQKLVLSGAVKAILNGKECILDKPSVKYPVDIQLTVAAIEELKYVSRAGLKLESALLEILKRKLIAVVELEHVTTDKRVLDIGQSTGGFTDFLLQTGASQVVGVDVGHNQLAKSLRDNNKIVALEGINARDLPVKELLVYAANGFDWVVMDVSFISQTLIIPHLAQCLSATGIVISLVKPQFEAGKNHIGKGGVVRDKTVFKAVKTKVCECMEAHNLEVLAYFKSGLTGTDGNQEFFVVARKSIQPN